MSFEEYFTFFKELSVKEWGSYAYQALFLVGLFEIFILEKKRERKNVFVWYSAILLIVIYNPVTLFLCRKIFGDADLAAYYCRLFLVIPIMFVIAYGFTLLLEQCEHRFKKMLLSFVAIIIIVMSGHTIYSEEWYVKAQNFNKVPNDALQVCSLVRGTDEEVKIMVPSALAPYIRQIDASIKMPYSRDQAGEEIALQVSSDTPDVEYILEYGLQNDCDYVVCLNSEEIERSFEEYGCSVLGYTEHYVVIRIENYYKITEYASVSGNQAMIYSIEDELGNLILVDGGWKVDAEQVRTIIAEHGNHVKAWILTHPHEDHISAFNVISAENSEIEIDTV